MNAKQYREQRDVLQDQVCKLSQYLVSHHPGEQDKDDNACATAIRMLKASHLKSVHGANGSAEDGNGQLALGVANAEIG